MKKPQKKPPTITIQGPRDSITMPAKSLKSDFTSAIEMVGGEPTKRPAHRPRMAERARVTVGASVAAETAEFLAAELARMKAKDPGAKIGHVLDGMVARLQASDRG